MDVYVMSTKKIDHLLLYAIRRTGILAHILI